MTIAQFTVPPVVKAVVVRAEPARAFEFFARDLARWWPLAQFHTGPDPDVHLYADSYAHADPDVHVNAGPDAHGHPNTGQPSGLYRNGGHR